MSIRALVFFLLFASAPALGQVPGGRCPVDTDNDDVIDADAECPPGSVVPRKRQAAPGAAAPAPSRPPLYALEVETIAGRSSTEPWDVSTSTLVRARFRPIEPLTISLAIPVVVASYRACGMRCTDDGSWRTFLGNIALDGAWVARAGRTRFPLRLLVALPTAWQYEYLSAPVAVVRGYEDDELIYPASLGIVPGAGIERAFGQVDLSASAKLPLVVRLKLVRNESAGYPYDMPNVTEPLSFRTFEDDSAVVIDAVLTAQAMVRVVERPGTTVSVGGRVIADTFLTWPGWPFRSERRVALTPQGASATTWREAFSVTFEPRVQARLGSVDLRLGVLLPISHEAVFPAAWGVRAGVGYSF